MEYHRNLEFVCIQADRSAGNLGQVCAEGCPLHVGARGGCNSSAQGKGNSTVLGALELTVLCPQWNLNIGSDSLKTFLFTN